VRAQPAEIESILKSTRTHNVRLLTVTDLHQRQALIRDLCHAVATHKPDAVAVVGDVLEALDFDAAKQLSAIEAAAQLAALPVEHLLFVRGNHEDLNWGAFVCAWPYSSRPLIALYGTAYTVGPLTLVGFPCAMGSEFTWCRHLEAQRDCMRPAPEHDRLELPADHKLWLPRLLQQTGPAGRTVWLMHEPPTWFPLATPQTSNPEWTRAVEKYQPVLTISGHDHQTPRRSGKWHAKLGSSTCVNVGQDNQALRFCVLDFCFPTELPTLPVKIEIAAYPTQQRLLIRPS
jgi:Icc-related predicted phosphoesterase